ncbi:g7938 [Coccomyxa elongata]
MALALYGASALVLQHREQVTSLLGKPKEVVATSLLRSAVQTLSAALFLIYYVELSFRSRNLLAKQHWRDLGLWATKLGFIVLSTHMLAYRCQQECDPRLFHTFREHFYRTQCKYKSTT